MKISGIDDLDVGMSNITIEGKVTYTLAPRNVIGEGVNGHYDFWSQFVVIEDETGKIGCNVVIDKENYKLEKGVMARVKGKLEEYENKKGEMQKSLKCSLIGMSKGNKVIDVQQEKAEEYFEEKAKIDRLTGEVEKPAPVAKVEKPADSVWEAKDLRIARECAVKAVTELVCAKIMESKDFFTFANTIVKYIYNGITEKPKEKEAKPAKKTTGRSKDSEPLEKREKGAPGSSIDNAIPRKSKKEALIIEMCEIGRDSEDEIDGGDIPF